MNYNRGFCRTGCDLNSPNRSSCNTAYGYTPLRRSVRDAQREHDNHHTPQHLAMVYSPVQEWKDIYCGEKALERGTLFAELDKPFKGYKSNRGCSC